MEVDSDHEYENDENCRVVRVVEVDQGPGKPPCRDYYNRLDVKLGIVKLNLKYDDSKFHEYAHAIDPGSGNSQWLCHWEKMENGVPSVCSYKSKKHLVKRHVEATHLNIK